MSLISARILQIALRGHEPRLGKAAGTKGFCCLVPVIQADFRSELEHHLPHLPAARP